MKIKIEEHSIVHLAALSGGAQNDLSDFVRAIEAAPSIQASILCYRMTLSSLMTMDFTYWSRKTINTYECAFVARSTLQVKPPLFLNLTNNRLTKEISNGNH
jgi:hypothetical protein